MPQAINAGTVGGLIDAVTFGKIVGHRAFIAVTGQVVGAGVVIDGITLVQAGDELACGHRALPVIVAQVVIDAVALQVPVLDFAGVTIALALARREVVVDAVALCGVVDELAIETIAVPLVVVQEIDNAIAMIEAIAEFALVAGAGMEGENPQSLGFTTAYLAIVVAGIIGDVLDPALGQIARILGGLRGPGRGILGQPFCGKGALGRVAGAGCGVLRARDHRCIISRGSHRAGQKRESQDEQQWR